MKKLIKMFGIIALIAVIMAACADPADDDLTKEQTPVGKTALTTPANVRVDDAGKTAFTLKWDAVSGVDKYELDIGGVLSQVSDSTTSYDLKALTFDPKVYPIRVRALAANGDDKYKDSAYSAPLNVEPAQYMFTTANVSASPSVGFSRGIARVITASDGVKITGLTNYGKTLETIVIPPKIGSATVTTIGASAFAGTDITSIKLPDTVTEILTGAFSNCPVLVIVVFVSVEPPAMANDVFAGSTALETIVVPEGSGTAYADTIEDAAPALAEKIEEAKPTPFNITVNTASGGRITTNPSGSALAGTSIMITVTPNSGYQLASLNVKDANNRDVNYQTVNSGNTIIGYSFIMPASNVTISAVFTSGPAQNTDVMGATLRLYDKQIANYPSTGNIPSNFGYTFGEDDITQLGSLITGTAEVTISGTRALTIKLDAPKETALTQIADAFKAGTGFTVNPNSAKFFMLESFCDSTGKTYLYCGSNTASASLLYVDRNVTLNGTITEINEASGGRYTMSFNNVSLQQGWNYVITTENTNGNSAVITATRTLPGGFAWRIDTNTGPGANQSYSIAVNSSPANGGTITTNPQGSAAAGTTVTININPSQGYTFSTSSLRVIDADNKAVNYQSNTSGGYFFTMPASNVTISGMFTQNSTGPGGNSGDPSGGDSGDLSGGRPGDPSGGGNPSGSGTGGGDKE
jgi:hypothetical protein